MTSIGIEPNAIDESVGPKAVPEPDGRGQDDDRQQDHEDPAADQERGQGERPGGRSSRASRATPRAAFPRGSRRGAGRRPRAWDRAAGSEDLESLEGRLDERRSRRRSGRSRRREAPPGRARSGGSRSRSARRRRPAGPCPGSVPGAARAGRRRRTRCRASGRASGSVSAPGLGAPPSSAASRRRSASPSDSAQTTWRGDATTMRVNSGNADPVDCR